MKFRNVILTYHLSESEEKVSETFAEALFKSPEIKCAVWQLERGDAAGKIHIQGYVEFKNQCRQSRAKEILGLGASVHIEARRGSRDSAVSYCTKDETRVSGPWRINGDKFLPGRGQGQRTDLDGISELVESGGGICDIAAEYPSGYIKYHRGIRDLLFVRRKNQAWYRPVRVLVHYGAPGRGKTRGVYEFADRLGESVFSVSSNGNGKLWFDGYDGEAVLLIDDFYGEIRYSEFLRLTDGYRLKIETKGGHDWANWKFIFITSNRDPRTWYRNVTDADPRASGALERRLHVIKEFLDEGEIVYHKGEEPNE